MAAKNMNSKEFYEAMEQGKEVLVVYWAPWCSYCRRIAPAYEKVAQQYGSDLVIAVNFAPVDHPAYRIGLPYPGTYEEIFTSNRTEFGGSGIGNDKIRSEKKPFHGQEQSAEIQLPGLSILFFKGRPRRKRTTKTEEAGASVKKTGPPARKTRSKSTSKSTKSAASRKTATKKAEEKTEN